MDLGKISTEVYIIFISVVLKVMPHSVIEGDWKRSLFIWGKVDEKIVSLLVSRITSKDPCNTGVPGLT